MRTYTINLSRPFLLLSLFLLVLKLVGVGISWFWVLAPILLPFAVVLLFAFVYVGLLMIFGVKITRNG